LNLRGRFLSVFIVYFNAMGGHKTLTISEEAYKKLSEIKRKGESFTDTIMRLTEGKTRLSKHAGAWKGVDDSDIERVFSEIEEAWHKGWPNWS